ncbi:unnamed protein product [Effrenium voratum]|nr:unnamed protein product [Effrenium voratum]
MEATLTVSKQTGVGRFRIDGFSLLYRKKGDPVSSGPIIEIGDAKWEILVYPSGNERCKDGWIRVSVRCISGQREVRALYSVSVLNAVGEVKRGGWGFDNFIRQERLTDRSKGFAEDVVVFEATVTVLGQEDFKLQPLASEPGAFQEDLAADLRVLWDSGQHSDLTLEVEDAALHVHSLILSARSAVFARMLASDMSEAKTRVIRIVDADAETMRLLCEYIYTGTLHERPWDSSELSACLLQAAAKYQVNGLVRWCSAKIAQTLVVDTVAEWLVLASQIGPQAEALKSKCLSLAASNLAEVQGTEGWQRFMKNPRVVSEVAPQLFQAISPPHPKKKPRRAGGDKN